MRSRFNSEDLAAYSAAQLSSFFPDRKVSTSDLLPYIGDALRRLELCFSHIVWPGYNIEGEATFDVFHSDQYCMYIYVLSNLVYRDQGPQALASKLFYLNKTLHGFNCMYDTVLPDVFWLVHVVGTVLGKAEYGNFLVVRQGCTIGALGGEYPVLGEGLVLSAGASIVGPCVIGDNVMIGPGCTVFKEDVPSNSLVTSVAGNTIRQNSANAFSAHFRR